MLQMMRVIDKATEAREYGLGLLLVSQDMGHFTRDKPLPTWLCGVR